MSTPQSNEQRCEKKVSDFTGFHFYACAKPAKYHVTTGSDGTGRYMCGIHANAARRRADTHVTALKETP